MTRASKACSEAGCPNLQPCPDHQRKPWEGSTRRTKLKSSSGHRQQKLSRLVIQRDDGICHVCGKPGADEADHVVPVSEGGDDDIYNMRAIHSDPCHKAKTQQEAARSRRRQS